MPSLQTTKKLKIIASRSALKSIHAWVSAFGFNVIKFIDALRGFPSVIREYFIVKKENNMSEKPFHMRFTMPCFDDKYSLKDVVSGHYFHQDLLVARKIFERNPQKHVDVASRIDGFVAHIATFRTIEIIDIRSMDVTIPGVVFKKADIMSPDIDIMEYCDSLSCLHALEHFGLGRYGDPIDTLGYVHGFENLRRILKKGGILYVSVPIGKERIDFNAHRVFNISTIMDMAKSSFELIGFSYVDDGGDLHENINLENSNIASNCGCNYGCGIFEYRKIA
jgi:hypothetical protein